ncbi:ParB/RepB/Spo0J family partition protein [Anaplasma capra]|uniref:ParB/RepB/Spo0J family partition protein n=1 Tax=Anaplasma capra TaxID=1562740 RepID=UPI0021D5E01F|nr:ParB/RepB/Spo0J family partition protein [Anaplasma capra]MCU7611165.1 ParB/RepB/Spo0J family partition protein [Anaplasma capra]MCU7612331.1 ParB/RepB/Spo0J family partition protein [Anaplasma capra]
MKRSLGKGILELIGEEEITDRSLVSFSVDTEVPVSLKVNMLHPGRFQPRQKFDQASIKELANSIAKKGLIQPIIVRKDVAGSRYEIIAGERRWRASIAAKLTEVPVIIRNVSDSECLEISVIENIQREDLTALEEAESYRKLIDEFRHTHESLATILGKSRSHVTNMLRILALPDSVKRLISDRAISFGHARCLLNVENPEELAERILSSGMSVRETEVMVKDLQNHRDFVQATIMHIENFLPGRLDTEVRVRKSGKRITLNFRDEGKCEEFLQMLHKL